MTHSVLSRIRPDQIRRNGFVVGIIENALPDDCYQALAETFPTEFIAGPQPLDNNVAYRKSTAEALSRPEIPSIWKDFLSYHCSKAFFAEFCDVFEEDIARLHPGLEANFGKPLAAFDVGVRASDGADDPSNADCDLVLDAQLSINSPVFEPSSVRGPHLDSPRKLFNALLYLRHPDDESTGGDLEFYRLKKGRLPGETTAIDPDLVEIVDSVPYGANTLVMFINCPHALHGVSPRSVAPMPRRYVNFLGECHGGKSAGFFRPPDRQGLWRSLLASARV